jgi:hypothetical protein
MAGRIKLIYLLLGGGLGLGVPVVSYAPRPMIISVWEDSLVIIILNVRDCATDRSAYKVPRGLYGGMQVARGLTHLEQGQRSTGVGQTDSLCRTNRLRAIARTGGLSVRSAVFGSWVRCWMLECDVGFEGGGASCDGLQSAKERNGREGARCDGEARRRVASVSGMQYTSIRHGSQEWSGGGVEVTGRGWCGSGWV